MKRSLVLDTLLSKYGKDNVLTNFYDVEFLVLVPRFSTLQHQTADRVEKEGLLYAGEAALDKVLSISPSSEPEAQDTCACVCCMFLLLTSVS